MTIQEKAEKWVNDGDWGHPVDNTGQWMFDKLVEAYKAGYMECTEQLHKPDVIKSVCPNCGGNWDETMSLQGMN